MKKLMAMLLSAALALSALTMTAETAYIPLQKGASGSEVKALQQRLIDTGFLNGAADGLYGNVTLAAVKALQTYLIGQGHQVPDDGAADEATQRLLFDDIAMREFLDIRSGQRGKKVSELQAALYDMNFLADPPDGVFGPKTEAAVRAFQEALVQGGVAGAEVNGIADKATRDALAGDLSGLGIAAPAFFDDTIPLALTEQFLYARAAAAADARTGEVLFTKDADKQMYPASVTKIMTLLVALEEGGDLGRQVKIPRAAGEVPKDSSLVPVYPGETMIFEDLLYSLMVRSGNDAANAVAVLVSGSVDKFVDAMNSKAQALGMQNTHFTNPHGYHDPAHYTTARDILTLCQAAIANADFVRIAAARAYTLPPNNRRGELPISHQYELFNPLSRHYYPGAWGIKSGYTQPAGFCYAGAAIRGDSSLIAVVLNCRTRLQAWDDLKRLFNYSLAAQAVPGAAAR